MHTVVEENVYADFILSRAHIDVVGGDFGEFFQNTLGANAHKFGRDCRGNEDFGHGRKLLYKLFCALHNGLGAVEFRIFEKLVNDVRTSALLTPLLNFVNGNGGIELVFFVGELDGVGGTFHQYVVDV